RAGFPAPHVVARQGDPDPDFPTVAKPNPEEPGTLDLALADARALGADLLLANDPDADRLAVAIPSPRHPDGWRTLTGDELGALLGDHLLTRTADPCHSLAVTTVVSSSLLRDLATAAGAQYAETLTGFKWIVRAAVEGRRHRFVFGYEEALGYAVNDLVRDKDGISAALVVAAMAAEAKHQGLTLADRLDDIARRFGLHITEQLSVELPAEGGPRPIDQIMAGLRASPPADLLGYTVDEIDDMAAGVRRFADGRQEPLGLPRSDVLLWRSRQHARVVIRPSGTEPKLKIYLEVVRAPGDGRDLAATTVDATRDLDRLRDQLRPALDLPVRSPER
ncbi:MAG: phospho-sugar mutase, partial [Acidimicrobiales bacterium]